MEGRILHTNILQYLEASTQRLPDKPAYVSENGTLTYAQLSQQAKAVGSHLAKMLPQRTAVAVLMARDVWTMAGLMGVLYAGCFSAPLDTAQPADRLEKVFQSLNPGCILADDTAKALLEDLGDRVPCPVVLYDEAVKAEIDQSLLDQRRARSTVFDPIQIFYTSGSTGVPKGVVYTHYNMTIYTEQVVEMEHLTEAQNFGNQAPFFYANVVWDMFPVLYTGATTYFTPKDCFVLPAFFLDYFQKNHISTVTMTPLNFIYIADSGVLTPNCLPDLETVFMCGEVVPYDKMKLWREAAPNARIYNFYGSTESPCMAEYILGDKEFAPGSLVPAGKPIGPVTALLIDDDGQEVAPGEVGEIYISSPWLSSGYYNDMERTNEVFVQSPLHDLYRDIYYRTGDLGKFNELGELLVVGRKDTQIKHRGYRMDLGEVETAVRSLEGWHNGCVLFDSERDLVYCFWTGPLTEETIKAALPEKIEKYMFPNVYVHLEELPRTSNGKLDRVTLKKTYFKD